MNDPTVLTAIVTGIFSLIGVVVVEMFRRQRRVLHEVRSQVKNSHSTNLRDDLDELRDGLGRVLASSERQEHSLNGIRTDLRVEREERLALAGRVQALESK